MIGPMSAQVMGVLNVTPDSFSDGGAWSDTATAVAHGRRLIDAGADIVDVGGESTRPGAEPVDAAAEADRVVPVIDALAPVASAAGVQLSVDTRRASVADAALRAGATLLNDVSSSLEAVAAEHRAGWIAMHMQGDPASMQHAPRYDDVVAEVLDAQCEAVARGRAAGVSECYLDPGIGFGKTFAHNWQLLAGLDRFVATGTPVVVGTSRKAFLGAALARSDARSDARTDGGSGAGHDAGSDTVPVDDRLQGSITTATWAASVGAAVVRVHDVRATVQAVTVIGTARPEATMSLVGAS